jgi:hypothetical protein
MAISENDLCTREIWDPETNKMVKVTMTIHNAVLFKYLEQIAFALKSK